MVATVMRSSVVLVIALFCMIATMDSGALAQRMSGAAAPAPSLLSPGHAAASLPSVVGPVVLSVLSFLALKHL